MKTQRHTTYETTLNDEIHDKIENALSSDVLETFGFKVINYLDLNKYNRIEDIDDILEKGIILYTPISERSLGHYSCIWMKEDKLYYWCSYGYNLNYTISKSNYMLSTIERDEDFLINLVKDYIRRGGIFIVNHVKFQNLSSNVSTCGRYSIIRLINKELSHEQFKSWLKLKKYPNMTSDELVTLLTYLV
mgnify:CR=1 FL=1